MQEFRRSVWIGFLWSIVFGTVLHFFVRLDRRKSDRGAVCRDQRKSVGTSETVVLPGVGLHRLGVHLGGTPLEGLRPDTGRGSTAGHADHYCPLYTYTGICGRHWLWADILTFVLGAAVTAFWTWKHTPHAKGGSWLGILLFAGVAVCFGIFSLFPPTVGIFTVP